ncbi:hypothetical protein C8039_13855 [Halogeometricum sp. wsp3]|nr:hypothetical protein C8039_13855 [Halogeometricum sp. wsp3]
MRARNRHSTADRATVFGVLEGATYFRYGLLGVKAHWSEEGVGIDAGEIVLAGDHEADVDQL